MARKKKTPKRESIIDKTLDYFRYDFNLWRAISIILMLFVIVTCYKNRKEIAESFGIKLEGIVGSNDWVKWADLEEGSIAKETGKNAGYVSIKKKLSTGSIGGFRCSGAYLGVNPESGKGLLFTNWHCIRSSGGQDTFTGADGVGFEEVTFDPYYVSAPSGRALKVTKILAVKQQFDFALLELDGVFDDLTGLTVATPNEILTMESGSDASNFKKSYAATSVNCDYYVNNGDCNDGIYKLWATDSDNREYTRFSNGNKRHYFDSAGGSSGSSFLSTHPNMVDSNGHYKVTGIHWGASILPSNEAPRAGASRYNWAKCMVDIYPFIEQFLPESGSSSTSTTTTTTTSTTTTTQPTVIFDPRNNPNPSKAILWTPYKKYCLLTKKDRMYCRIEKYALKFKEGGWQGQYAPKLDFYNEPAEELVRTQKSDQEIYLEMINEINKMDK